MHCCVFQQAEHYTSDKAKLFNWQRCDHIVLAKLSKVMQCPHLTALLEAVPQATVLMRLKHSIHGALNVYSKAARGQGQGDAFFEDTSPGN